MLDVWKERNVKTAPYNFVLTNKLAGYNIAMGEV
jgi:hypothetical protein